MKFSNKNYGLLIALSVGVIILFLDQWSKYWVHTTIPRMQFLNPWYPYQGVGVFENLIGIEASIVHAVNKGAAWGVLADFQISLLFFRIVFVLCLFAYVLFFNKSLHKTIPLVLVAAGALGNIFDYFFYGHVVDMIHFVFWGYDYPVFNLADAAIFIGVFWLAGQSWIKPHDKADHSSPPSSR